MDAGPSLKQVLVGETIPESRSAAAKPTTLEAHHRAKMREFESAREGIATLEEELAEAEAQLDEITATAMFSDEWRVLTERVEALRGHIKKLANDEGRLDYFLEVGDMLFQYYDAQDSIAHGAVIRKGAGRMPANSVLSYFSGGAGAGAAVEPPAAPAKSVRASVVDTTAGLERDKMLERYLAVVDPAAIKSGILPGSGIEPGWGSCPACSVEMTFYQNEAKLGCPSCGYEEFILIDSEKPSYKDPPREITYFAYKKANHFNEWLAQFQAKENTDIPADVIEAVLAELRKERILDPKKVKKEKILEVLRKLKLSKMYDHVQQIKNRIQQQMTSLTLSKETEEKLQHMFKEIQPAFIKYCPKGRSNFLSYPYVLYKMCQLLEMDEFLPCFQLLKSREKLYQQDQVWQKICAELGWQFIRSI
jgi:predicted  nucleic acid-binding Zn-ribbon protein